MASSLSVDASAVTLAGILRPLEAEGTIMNDYATAWDSLAETIGAAKGNSSGSITDLDHLTIDQRLKVAEVAALLSIAQELSVIHHAGINPEYHSDI